MEITEEEKAFAGKYSSQMPEKGQGPKFRTSLL